MRSTSALGGARARRASSSSATQWLGRAGLAARGIIYILMGVVAVLVAIGHSSHPADQQGALQLLAAQPYGLVALVLLALGFIAYALWQLSQAAFGVTGEDDSAMQRLKAAGIAVAYAGLAYLTIKVIIGAEGSQSRQQQDFTATVMRHPFGRWVVGVAGLVVLVAGVIMAIRGFQRKFMKYFQGSPMSATARRVTERLGMIGTIARGLVFALVGGLIIDAAVTHHARHSGGLDKALLTLRHQTAGPYLLLIAAIGLAIFGCYGLCEARWRRV